MYVDVQPKYETNANKPNMQPKYATNATNQCTQTQICNQCRASRRAGGRAGGRAEPMPGGAAAGGRNQCRRAGEFWSA